MAFSRSDPRWACSIRRAVPRRPPAWVLCAHRTARPLQVASFVKAAVSVRRRGSADRAESRTFRTRGSGRSQSRAGCFRPGVAERDADCSSSPPGCPLKSPPSDRARARTGRRTRRSHSAPGNASQQWRLLSDRQRTNIHKLLRLASAMSDVARIHDRLANPMLISSQEVGFGFIVDRVASASDAEGPPLGP